MLTIKDIEFINDRGNAVAQVNEQYEILRRGISYTELIAPATAGDGITVLDTDQQKKFCEVFEQKKSTFELLKFVPASGAATRMFKFLFKFLHDYDVNNDTINGYINKTNAYDLRLFFVGIESFPFFEKVLKRLKKESNFKKYSHENYNKLDFIGMMLDEDGFDFGNKPKGLFPFHLYKHHAATAFEEHLFEAASYSCNNNLANIHLTISKDHHDAFKKLFDKRQSYIEKKTRVKFNISYSYQLMGSDTVALSDTNELLRDSKNQIVFRPGGHGALINNLNDQEVDIIFIKNIDNVVVHKYSNEVAFYKKMLGGILIEAQEKSFTFLKKLDQEESLADEDVKNIAEFITLKLCIRLSENFEKLPKAKKIEFFKNQLDRPLRVCGMVKNEGEPGGGPFWVRDKNGTESLQIIESVQIDPNDKEQQQILKNSTHFNPVDIVCGVKDYRGNKFNLLDYVDYEAGFIASKSYQGQKIKALEHPGLWNGAMAHWNTIFVEVPLITFNPVKTVNDLLKPAHQVK